MKGWECPKCGRGMAPHMNSCDCVEQKADPLNYSTKDIDEMIKRAQEKSTPTAPYNWPVGWPPETYDFGDGYQIPITCGTA